MRNSKAYEIIVNTYNKLEKLNCTDIIDKDINGEVDYIEMECNGLNLKITKFHNEIFGVADNINCEVFLKINSSWYSLRVDWSESKGMIKKIKYSREGEFLTNPDKDYKALNLTEISQFMDNLLNQFTNDEIMLEQELINDSIIESIEPESEPEQTENTPGITKDQRIELLNQFSIIEDKLFDLYKKYFDSFRDYFFHSKNEITIFNMNNIYLSMNYCLGKYRILVQMENKFDIKLILDSDSLEIKDGSKIIDFDSFIDSFNKAYEAIEMFFEYKTFIIFDKLREYRNKLNNYN